MHRIRRACPPRAIVMGGGGAARTSRGHPKRKGRVGSFVTGARSREEDRTPEDPPGSALGGRTCGTGRATQLPIDRIGSGCARQNHRNYAAKRPGKGLDLDRSDLRLVVIRMPACLSLAGDRRATT
jgi:hypothetical protein